MMKKWWLCFVLFLALACPTQVWAAESAAVTLPDFAVTLNGVAIDNSHRQYPLLVYKGMTYFPLTYDDSRFLGLETGWTEEAGLTVERTNVSAVYKEALTGSNSRSLKARTVDFPVTVNGEKAQADGTYPFLSFRGVTYIPLTWHYCTELFGWEQHFDAKAGLMITASNPQIQTIAPEKSFGDLTLQGKRLWAVDDGAVLTLLLDQPEQRTVLRELSNSQGQEFVQFARRGDERYAVLDVYGRPESIESYYRLLADGTWEPDKAAADHYVVRWDDIVVSIEYSEADKISHLYVQKGEEPKRLIGDPTYQYRPFYWPNGGEEYLLRRGGEVVLLADDMLCLVDLESGKTTVLADHVRAAAVDGADIYYRQYDADMDMAYLYRIRGNGAPERLTLKQTYSGYAGEFAALGGKLYYSDNARVSAPMFVGPFDEEEQKAVQAAYDRWQELLTGTYELYRLGETESLAPGGEVLMLRREEDYVWCELTEREQSPAAPYHFMVFDRAGKVVFKTTDDVYKHVISEGRLAYITDGGCIYWVELT